MIYEKLLALGARERGKQREKFVKANLGALEGDVATEELYRTDILSKVRVTDEELQQALERQRTRLNLRWLFAPDRAQIDSMQSALRRGISFTTLFDGQFSDVKLTRADRMMETTKFSLERRNKPFGNAIDSLLPRTPSQPIPAPDGWYIVQIDTLRRDVAVTESERNKLRYEARRALIQAKADSMSDRYVRNIMLGADPVIQRRTFDILRASLGAVVLKRDKFEAFGLADRFRQTHDSVDYTHPERYDKEVLVTLRRGKVTLGEFLNWYRLREMNITLRQNSPQAFFLSLEDLVWRMIRDNLLAERARKRGLYSGQSVKLQSKWWEEKMLYQIEKDSIMRTIGWTDSTLRKYYDEHPRSFMGADGKTQPFERVKDDVLREWYALELDTRVMRRISSLKSRYSTVVKDRVLQGLPVDTENSPRAIEVYAVKKGGTFPHPAFPTIDQFWKTWN
jgi:hypothetical protein